MTSRLRQAVKSGLVYGLGLLTGSLISELLAAGIRPGRFLGENQGAALVQGILLAFLFVGLGGFVAGFAGGWTLPVAGRAKGKWGYAWESGITLGIGYGLLVFPVLLIISLLSFYEIASIPAFVFCLIFALIGLIFGLILGAILGVWTLRRFYGPAIWAGGLGFALGGAGLGYGLWRYLLSVTNGQVGSGRLDWLSIGLFLFGAIGGAALGLVYFRAADRFSSSSMLVHRLTSRGWLRRAVIWGSVVFVLALIIRPVLAGVGDLLTPIDAQISPILDLNTSGTHWLDASPMAQSDDQYPAAASNRSSRLALGFVEDDIVTIREGEWAAGELSTAWQTAAPVSREPNSTAGDVEVAVADDGRLWVVWTEVSDGGAIDVMISDCEEQECSEPVLLSSSLDLLCPGGLGAGNEHPSLAINDDGKLMLVWENDAGPLAYVTWMQDEAFDSGHQGCVSSSDAEDGLNPRLAADEKGVFHLVFETPGGQILMSRYLGGEWDGKSMILGDGRHPEIFAEDGDEQHAAWCMDDMVIYWSGGSSEVAATSGCELRPAIGMDKFEQLHLLWASGGVQDATGRLTETPLLMESVYLGDGWGEPSIAAHTKAGSQPALTTAADGSLHLVFNDPEALSYAAQVQYQCDEEDLSYFGEIMYEIGRREEYIPADDPLPYCGNQYDRLIITPNPDPAFSDQQPMENGAFDVLAELIRGAEYEALYSTMWYDSAENHDSPGAVIAGGVADLYQMVRAHPERYPRGMTVRILLDNPPEMTQGEATGQLWSLLGDLRNAGIDTMVDEEIGWRLEVADYEGNMPHSHVKSVIIDGKTAVAAGFNTTYNHFDKEHPSGKGNDRFDLALQISGPAAQATLRMFDDMWVGADQRHCISFTPPYGIPWQAACYDKTAVGGHAAEVLKYYLPGGSSNAFSLYRSKKHDAADQQIVATLAAAQESIDVIHVNFTLDLVCNLNILFDICPVGISPDYMQALIKAAENGAKIRVLIKPAPFEGIENTVAIDAIKDLVRESGLEQQIELRFYEGDMHPKASLIDDQMLIIGSQNFHYSAFGSGSGLNEYGFAVEDEQAVEDFKRVFEYMWGQGVAPKS